MNAIYKDLAKSGKNLREICDAFQIKGKMSSPLNSARLTKLNIGKLSANCEVQKCLLADVFSEYGLAGGDVDGVLYAWQVWRPSWRAQGTLSWAAQPHS